MPAESVVRAMYAEQVQSRRAVGVIISKQAVREKIREARALARNSRPFLITTQRCCNTQHATASPFPAHMR